MSLKTSKGRMGLSRVTWGHLRRSDRSRSISWRCGKDSWSVFLMRPVSEGPPRWQAPHPTSSWLDSWKGNFLFCAAFKQWKLYVVKKKQCQFDNNFFALQLLSRLRPYQFWLLVCIRFPTHASLPVFGMDLDCVSLRGIEYTVMWCQTVACYRFYTIITYQYLYWHPYHF